MKGKIFFVTILVFVLSAGLQAQNTGFDKAYLDQKYLGLSRYELFTHFTKNQERTYRTEENEEWLTFDLPERSTGSADIVTFHLQNGIVAGLGLNDRNEVVKEYLSEFASKAFIQKYSKIYRAIENVLTVLPQEVFLAVTERDYPVLFTEYYYTGTGRIANSSDTIVFEYDPPTFTKGFWLIKLSAELEEAEDIGAIEGVVAHELAHRVLKHSHESYSPEMEVKADSLVNKWGLDDELAKAKTIFGNNAYE